MLTTVALSVVALMLSLREPPSNVYLIAENADNANNTYLCSAEDLSLNFPSEKYHVVKICTSQWSKGCQGSPEGKILQTFLSKRTAHLFSVRREQGEYCAISTFRKTTLPVFPLRNTNVGLGSTIVVTIFAKI